MKTQFTRFSVVVSLFLAPWTVSAAPSIPVPRECEAGRADASINWIDQLLECLREVYRGLGGDPAKFNLEVTLNGKFGLIADQYAASGVPAGLEGPELEALAGSIQRAYSLLSVPPPGVVVNSGSFLRVLHLIWNDLGLPPEQLL